MSTSFMFCVFLALVASLISAIPLGLVPRDIEPPITLPTAGTVWTVGSTQKITWNTSYVPTADANLTANLVLGWLDGVNGENLQFSSPLAKDVLLGAGAASIKVPDYPQRDTYIVCLFGSSGNTSPQFTIKGGSGSASPPASSSTIPIGPSTIISNNSSTVSPPTVVGTSSQTGPSSIVGSSTPFSTPLLSSTPAPSSTNSSGSSLGQSTSLSPSGAGNTSGANSMFTTNNVLLSAITASLVALFI